MCAKLVRLSECMDDSVLSDLPSNTSPISVDEAVEVLAGEVERWRFIRLAGDGSDSTSLLGSSDGLPLLWHLLAILERLRGSS